MHSIKLRAFAVLITFFIGSVLSVILITALISVMKSSDKLKVTSSESLAYFAAKSGINEGLLKYKKFQSDPGRLFESIPSRSVDINDSKASYDLSIGVSPLSLGGDLNASNWYSDSQQAAKQKAYEITGDKDFYINLKPFFSADQANRPQEITLYVSDPFKLENNALNQFSDSTARISYSLKDGSKILGSQTIETGKSHELDVDGLGNCSSDGAMCELKISINPGSSHHVFLKIKAEDSRGAMKASEDEPGTILIHSVGYFLKDKVDLVYKIDSSGKALGMFYEGVKCTDSCYAESAK